MEKKNQVLVLVPFTYLSMDYVLQVLIGFVVANLSDWFSHKWHHGP